MPLACWCRASTAQQSQPFRPNIYCTSPCIKASQGTPSATSLVTVHGLRQIVHAIMKRETMIQFTTSNRLVAKSRRMFDMCMYGLLGHHTLRLATPQTCLLKLIDSLLCIAHATFKVAKTLLDIL